MRLRQYAHCWLSVQRPGILHQHEDSIFAVHAVREVSRV